jgi:hypothetical protein
VLIFYASAECLLHLMRLGIIILIRGNRRHSGVEPNHRAENAQSGSVALGSPDLGSLEEAMTTRLAAITLTILFAAVSLTGRAEAGASASAPSKNARANQLAAQQTNHKTAKNDVGITEYSSSSSRNRH